jgi:ornithine cyclodeaminase
MFDNDILIIKGSDVAALLEGQELEVIRTVAKAYAAHARGESSLPHSTFLRFPDDPLSRIIALPAYLGDGFDVAGIKWVASFPSNLARGLDRASAVVILSSSETGRPEAIVEGSIISAQRTAASAALAALALHQRRGDTAFGLVGCGLINFEVTRYLLASQPHLRRLTIHDKSRERAEGFAESCARHFPQLDVSIAPDIETVFRHAALVSFATTAVKPHVFDLSACLPGTTILHVSLRDLAPEVILECDNVVDDIDHVLRAETSVHLAENLSGSREFIRCTLADVLANNCPVRQPPDVVQVFSPFGLGVLDMAVSKFVRDLSRARGAGTLVPSFLPTPWN